MHEASGRILALATPLCFTRSPRTRPGRVDQMAGWLCRQAASMVDGGQVNQVRRPVACRYVAAGPELSAGLPPIPGLPWESLSHRQVLAELAAGGWVPCGVGDWAVALRSPEGTLVARVCPFDPAYWAFVDLCRECAGNRWLPRIELAADLEGGGSVLFVELAARGRMTARRCTGNQRPMLQAAPEQRICRPSQPTSWQRQPAPDRRLSEDVPVYAAPDQDVCGVDMSLNSVHAVAA